MNRKIIKTGQTACEWESSSTKKSEDNKSRIIRHRGAFKWTSVKTDKYKKDGDNWSLVIRRVLTGNRGESAKFHLRYFEIAPGGYSSFERHKHEHVVVCIRGRGKVILDNKRYSVSYLDVVYISPNTTHQLINPYDEPFGFFCIVNAKRDKPRIINQKNSWKIKPLRSGVAGGLSVY